MRERQALRMARAFVRENYPEFADAYIEVALEHDGERRRNWSCGVHPKGRASLTGYVHDFNPLNDGPAVEGLY